MRNKIDGMDSSRTSSRLGPDKRSGSNMAAVFWPQSMWRSQWELLWARGLAVLSCLSLFVYPSLNPLFLFLGAYVHVLPLHRQDSLSNLICHNMSGSTPASISPTTPMLEGESWPQFRGDTFLSGRFQN